MRPDDEAVCQSKIPYPTAAAAHEVRRRLIRKKKRRQTYVYRCNVCHEYHLANVEAIRWRQRASPFPARRRDEGEEPMETQQEVTGRDMAVREAMGALQRHVHQTAREKGWYATERSVPEVIALMHSELSEALEEYRRLRPDAEIADVWTRPSDGKPEGFATEMADCVIRIMDTCEHLGIDLADAILAKASFNLARSYRHGNKRA